MMSFRPEGRGDRYAPIKRLALVQLHPPRPPNKPLTSFFIADILSGRNQHSVGKTGGSDRVVGLDRQHHHHHHHHNHNVAALGGPGIVRPWADSPPPTSEESQSDVDADDDVDVEIDVDDTPRRPSAPTATSGKPSPLDALLQMTNKTFAGLDPNSHNPDDLSRRDQLSLFSKSQPPKKRRKSRTAFTNQQIYELEKRFLYQKYLTPADRDDIASSLGLSNAQVITWFQNRRAKLKRDLEELKADVTAAKSIDSDSSQLYTSPEDVAFFQQHGHQRAEKRSLNDSSVLSNSSQPGSPLPHCSSSCASDSPVAETLSKPPPSKSPRSSPGIALSPSMTSSPRSVTSPPPSQPPAKPPLVMTSQLSPRPSHSPFSASSLSCSSPQSPSSQNATS